MIKIKQWRDMGTRQLGVVRHESESDFLSSKKEEKKMK